MYEYAIAWEWLAFAVRWLHVITGIAWIGASFYFVGLDSSLTRPADEGDRAKGVGGELWAVHGGGFYHQQKYPVSPARLPRARAAMLALRGLPLVRQNGPPDPSPEGRHDPAGDVDFPAEMWLAAGGPPGPGGSAVIRSARSKG